MRFPFCWPFHLNLSRLNWRLLARVTSVCRAAFITNSAEFVAFVPVWPSVCHRQHPRDRVIDFQVSHHTVPVPVRIKLVFWPVVAFFGIFLANRLASRFAAVDQVFAAFKIDHRNALLCKAEMIRAV